MNIDQRAAYYVGKWKADLHKSDQTLETWVGTAIMDMREDCALWFERTYAEFPGAKAMADRIRREVGAQ